MRIDSVSSSSPPINQPASTNLTTNDISSIKDYAALSTVPELGSNNEDEISRLGRRTLDPVEASISSLLPPEIIEIALFDLQTKQIDLAHARLGLSAMRRAPSETSRLAAFPAGFHK